MQYAKRVKALLLLFCFSVCSSYAKIKHVIFDLGGVLFEANSFTMSREIGLSDLISHIFSGNKTADIKTLMYDALEQAGGAQQGNHLLCDYEGRPLPQIFADWQRGTKSSKQIAQEIEQTIDQLFETGYYKTKRAYRIAKNGSLAMTNHQTLAQTMRPSSKGVNLVTKIADQIDEQGNQKYNLYVLSNWDPESFELVFESSENAKIFKHFHPDRVLYSGKYGIAKPDPAFFNLLLEMHNLNPKECLFIDDQIENIETARTLGFNTMLWNSKKASKLMKKLKKLNIIE